MCRRTVRVGPGIRRGSRGRGGVRAMSTRSVIKSDVSSTAGDTAQLEGAPEATAAVQRRPQAAARPSRWTGGRIAALVIGALLVLVALVLLGAGGTGVWADLTQREAGYVTTGEHAFSAAGSALATESTHLGSPGVGWLYSPGLLGKVRIRVTPVGPPVRRCSSGSAARAMSTATSPGSTTPSSPTSSATRSRPSAAARRGPLRERSASGLLPPAAPGRGR